MANRNADLVKVWDGENLIEKNIDFLRTPTKPVTFPISSHIKQIIEDLVDTFTALPCAGIAANQIGYDKKLFIGMKHDRDYSEIDDKSTNNIDDVTPDPDNYEIYINPQIDNIDKKSTQEGAEGCLSIPNITLMIERYDKIKVRYYNGQGRVIKKPLSGFISRLFQHELNHLHGKLMFENPLSNISVDTNSVQNENILIQIEKLVKYCKI